MSNTMLGIAERNGRTITDNIHLSYLCLLDYISVNCAFVEIKLSNNEKLEYLSDFYGLLKHRNCNPKLNYLNLLLNNLNSSNEFNGNMSTIYIVDETGQKIQAILMKLHTIGEDL